MSKTKLQRSNLAHYRLADKAEKRHVLSKIGSMEYFKSYLSMMYHHDVYAEQRYQDRLLSKKEKKAIYNKVKTIAECYGAHVK